ncbi:MAG: UDP-N-acetylmuramoyl-tripeptide--D-alanyl-D-alanine ligase, partial [Candidatus Margulisiibacteriota bacterium]
MFTIEEIIKLVPDSRIEGPVARGFTSISTDSRKTGPGQLFIPIKGVKYDGYKFIPEALRRGASALFVNNGLKALQILATCHRDKFKIPFVGVTGSSGKTTTKDMLASILAQEKQVLKNEGNFNNEIGVPLTLLNLTNKHQVAVIEMGMRGFGEIRELAEMVRPKIAIVTNIGESHLAHLKTKKNIARAKAEIFAFLRRTDYAVINQDDEYFEHLKERARTSGAKVITFGVLERSDVGTKELLGIDLPVPGEHNIYNALAAIAAARILKIKRSSIVKGLSTVPLSSRRMHVFNYPDRTKIIDDTYNANPQSMAAALKTIGGMSGRKIAVLGSMLELGRRTNTAHRQALALARKQKVVHIFTFGDYWPKSANHYN